MADKMQRSDGHREGDWRGFTLPWLIIGGAFVALVAPAC